jgi:PAS domain S-box-containing protein
MSEELEQKIAELECELVQSRAREESLRATNAQLIHLINSSPAAIITLDQEGKVNMWNPAAELIFGWNKDEVLGQVNPIVPKSQIEWFFQRHTQVVQGQPLVGVEVERKKKDGTPIDVSISSAQVLNEAGDVDLIIGIMLDITQRKKVERENQELLATLEQRVRQRTAELEGAIRDLESFSYSISHDLRAPLRSINSFANILLEDYEESLDEEARDLLQRVVNNSRRMSELIDDLLEFSRTGRQPLHRQPTDITAMAGDILNELRLQETSDRRVEVVMGQLPPAQVDPSLFRQVLVNLLSNAWKFTRRSEGARIEVSGQQVGDELVYVVQDNGAGFSMDYADKLFAVFQRLHRAEEFEGTGVGLAIVAKIVNRHGGTISAQGELGKGARFEVRLPQDPV